MKIPSSETHLIVGFSVRNERRRRQQDNSRQENKKKEKGCINL